MGPDGSKEGWPGSEAGNTLRHDFIIKLKEKEDYWRYIEIGYGELGQEILQGNNEDY